MHTAHLHLRFTMDPSLSLLRSLDSELRAFDAPPRQPPPPSPPSTLDAVLSAIAKLQQQNIHILSELGRLSLLVEHSREKEDDVSLITALIASSSLSSPLSRWLLLRVLGFGRGEGGHLLKRHCCL
jgi:hypothetical protein